MESSKGCCGRSFTRSDGKCTICCHVQMELEIDHRLIRTRSLTLEEWQKDVNWAASIRPLTTTSRKTRSGNILSLLHAHNKKSSFIPKHGKQGKGRNALKGNYKISIATHQSQANLKRNLEDRKTKATLAKHLWVHKAECPRRLQD